MLTILPLISISSTHSSSSSSCNYYYYYLLFSLLNIIIINIFLISSLLSSSSSSSSDYYYYYYYCYIPCEFLTAALGDGLSLESVWHQVFWGLQDSSQYSVRSQQCYSLLSLIFWSPETAKSTRFSHILLIISGSNLWAGIRWSILSKNPREFYTSHSTGQVLVCANII